MLTRIRLKNFQCHKRLDVDCSKSVTYIKGKSDSGKSAIIRALKWVLLNGVPGNGFIRQGKTEAMVSCEFADENFAVTRRRTASKNVYRLTLDDEGRQHKDFVSFGTSVPDPIARELRVSAENLQSQHDAPFWISLSDTQAAAQLNSIVRLEAVDRSIGRILDMKRKSSNTLTSIDSEIAEKTKRLESATRVPAERFTEVQELVKALNTKRADDLADLLDDIEKARETKRQAPRIQDISERLAELEKLAHARQVNSDRWNSLSELLVEIEETEHQAVESLRLLKEAQKSLASIKVCPECQQPLK